MSVVGVIQTKQIGLHKLASRDVSLIEPIIIIIIFLEHWHEFIQF